MTINVGMVDDYMRQIISTAILLMISDPQDRHQACRDGDLGHILGRTLSTATTMIASFRLAWLEERSLAVISARLSVSA